MLTTIHFCHAPDQLLIFSARAINIDSKEETFNLPKAKADLISNKKS